MEDVISDSEDGKTLASIFGSRKLNLKSEKRRKSTDVHLPSRGTSQQNKLGVLSVPPGFPPKYNDGVVDVAMEIDKSTVREVSEFIEKLGGVVESCGDCSKASLNYEPQFHLSSCSENDLAGNMEQVPDSRTVENGEPAIGNYAAETNLFKISSEDGSERTRYLRLVAEELRIHYWNWNNGLGRVTGGLEDSLAKVKREFAERGLIVR